MEVTVEIKTNCSICHLSSIIRNCNFLVAMKPFDEKQCEVIVTNGIMEAIKTIGICEDCQHGLHS